MTHFSHFTKNFFLGNCLFFLIFTLCQFGNSLQFLFCIVQANMCISVQSHSYICMSHKVLQSFGIHTRLCHVATISMLTHMRCHFRQFFFIDAIVFSYNMFKILFPMQLLPSAYHFYPSKVNLLSHLLLALSSVFSFD